jgi:TetR/AcrR family transcriptional repressor of nem operon
MMAVIYTVKRATEDGMRVSREQVAKNRQAILEAAARLFRARGFEAVTVAEVMQAAGLTHGGFYSYFPSKDALIAEALATAVSAATEDEIDLARYARGYLSRRHRDDIAGGCSTAGLGGEALRQGPEARAAMTAGLKRQIARFSRTAPGEDEAAKRRAAIGSWSAMVGAVILARLCDDAALSDEVLAETRAWIGAQAGE